MRRSTIIICITAVVLLSAGIVLLALWPEPVPEQNDVRETPPPRSAETVGDIIREQRAEVSSISFTPDEGDRFTIRLDLPDMLMVLEANDLLFSGDQASMSSLFTTATNLFSLDIVIEDADDEQLDMFGFNAPVVSINVDLLDGTSIEYTVGNVQPAGQGRYILLKDSRDVLLINGRQSSLLTQGIEDLYDLSFFPLQDYNLDEPEAIAAVNHIIIENEAGITELQKRTEEELVVSPIGTALFKILQPTVAEANDQVVQDVILHNIVRIEPESIEAVHPDDLSAYGLNKPAKLSVSTDDWKGTLLVGNRNAERGGHYIMIEGTDIVLFDKSVDYSFINITFTELRTSLIWLHNIVDVSSVVYNIDGVTRVFEMEHPDENTVRGWLDGVEMTEQNTRRLYVAALNITQNGVTDRPIPVETPPTYSITINLSDGSSDTIDLYPLSDTQFLIVRNGESTGLFITRMTIQQYLLGRLEMVDAGGELPLT